SWRTPVSDGQASREPQPAGVIRRAPLPPPSPDQDVRGGSRRTTSSLAAALSRLVGSSVRASTNPPPLRGGPDRKGLLQAPLPDNVSARFAGHPSEDSYGRPPAHDGVPSCRHAGPSP